MSHIASAGGYPQVCLTCAEGSSLRPCTRFAVWRMQLICTTRAGGGTARRARSRTDADVALALARLNDARAAEERKRRRLIDEAASRREALDELNGEAAVAAKKLRASNKAIAEAEKVVEAKHALKSLTVEQLGAGKKNCGGAAGKKKRGEVLDRMARHGTGLSAPQRNDFAWFKDAWDTAMLGDHGADWARTFAELMQRLLNDIQHGSGNAFSMFAHSETHRKFATEVALVVP